MFTGIISDIGTILELSEQQGLEITIGCGYAPESIRIGESIAVSGTCLTVTQLMARADFACAFKAFVSHETVARTVPGMWMAGRRVNLERALKASDELSGHLVTGHIDGLAVISAIIEVENSREVTLTCSPLLSRYIAAKGSVTLDGISLTVNQVNGQEFTVNIIPHSWEITSLSERKAGDAVNLEVDLVARYVERLLSARGES